jgi:hypothetical protein
MAGNQFNDARIWGERISLEDEKQDQKVDFQGFLEAPLLS